jgi:hypothetical protein
VGACLVWCGLDAAITMYVGCRQFLGIAEALTQFRYLKKISSPKLLIGVLTCSHNDAHTHFHATPTHVYTLILLSLVFTSASQLQPHGRGDRNRSSDTCAVVTNAVTRRGATRCRNHLPPEHLHHGTVVLKLHIHDRRSLRSIEASAHTPTIAPRTPTDPGLSVWGPRLSHRPSLPRTQVTNAAKSISSTLPSLRTPPHQAQQLKSSRTHGPSAPRQQPFHRASSSTTGQLHHH